MQRGFTKLFNTIVTSTIWQEDDKTRIVWITMLAISDPYGIVSASIPGLASVANVSVDETRLAVKNLLSPDPDSRTKDYEGRRIEEIDGGWRILNYVKYRKMLSEAERADYKAKWIREKRRQKSTMSTEGDANGQKSTVPSASSSTSASVTEKEIREYCVSIGLPSSDGEAMFLHWSEKKWPKNWKLTIKKWKSFGYMPSQKQRKNGAHPDNPKPLDKSKIEVPERFKAWVSERYPAQRESAMKWQTWADVPSSGLRDEWWREEKSKLPIGDML